MKVRALAAATISATSGRPLAKAEQWKEGRVEGGGGSTWRSSATLHPQTRPQGSPRLCAKRALAWAMTAPR
jgi:hypothetical protein